VTSLMGTSAPVRILCVDDEPHVLEGLSRNLRRDYDVLTATSGAGGLALLQRERSICVVMSDMRMPEMNGAAFLNRARQVLPEAVRVLLTGQSDIDSAMAAVNEGQIFRFLMKPCPPTTLLDAMAAAAEQHRLITAERVLLEQTLNGTIKTLVEVLSLTHPIAFGRAMRVRRRVLELADRLGMADRWQVEIASMLSHLAYVTLPTEVVEKVVYQRPLSPAEATMVERLPSVSEQLLGSIPRLEGVRAILAALEHKYWQADPGTERLRAIERSAQVLKVARDFDALKEHGQTASLSIDTLRGRADRYDPEVLLALAAVLDAAGAGDEVREVPLSALRVGMVFVDDVRLSDGRLLVSRGHEVTASLVERVRNFSHGAVREPVRVTVAHSPNDTRK